MGFLDRQPFDAGDPDGRALLAALQAVYDQAPAVRELVLAAGLRPADFPWLAPMSQVWPEVLRKAADRGRLRSLITAAAQDPGSAAYEVIARLVGEPAGGAIQHPAGRPEPVIGSGKRLAYLEQIRRIAPPDPPGLIGRNEELAELARFCLQPDAGPYAWWQAEAWAGKSALLSTFVLRPPPQVAQRVRIVSFFVTARLAAQDTREAFIQVLLEQLAALLDQPLPPALPEATREAFLLALMAEAATMCAERGGRLVLVVDGLDEDRGVTIGPDAHSIAGMLPADPSHGMRVIVAGRPNPPVPDDVPDWHPLRKPEIIRPLGASPYAGDLKRLSRQELRRLLGGSRGDQDVLGLLTAAHGGLSAPDLAELTGIPLWEAEEILHTAAGRTFTRRASRWTPGSGPETYLLGHEELQAAAVAYLGENRLSAYRERLHAWASTWQARGWPPDTPEYLLGGYYRLLDEFGDLPRMIECAGDLARHDRMLDVIGGDAAAIAEVRTVLDRIAAQDTPDLGAAVTLACHRDYLVSRNANIPAALPAVWATLGHLPRADALAASIIAPRARAEALAGVARALARDGLPEQAEAVARSITYTRARAEALAGVARALARDGLPEQAEAIARSIPYTSPRAEALAEVAGALSAAGQREQAVAIAAQAEAVAQSITNPSARGRTLADVAGALARDELHERAEAIARSINSPGARAGALADVAGALAAAGQRVRAAAVAAQAEATARSITQSSARVLALAKAAGALAAAGHRGQAAAVAAQAEAAARSITSPGTRAHALAGMAAALARDGLHERAEAVARSITKAGAQAQALAEIAGPLARDGRRQQAEAVARSIANPDLRAQALADVAGALAAAGQREQAAAVAAQAEEAARSITKLDGQARALADVAGALAAAGQHQQAQAITRSLRGRGARTRALAGIVDALAAAGQYEQAGTAAQSITDPGARAHALARVARVLAAAGLREQATTVAAQAEATARSITQSSARAQALAEVAGELAAAGQREQAAAVAAQAEAVARSITNTDWQAQAHAKIAGVLAATGQHEQALQAEAIARSISSPYWQAQAWGRIAGALAASGRHEQAHAIVQSITRGDWQERARARIAGALAAAGQYEQARAIARSITTPGTRARILADVAEGLARTGQTESASQLAAVTCATGDWTIALRPVMLLAPSTCTLVIAMLDGL